MVTVLPSSFLGRSIALSFDTDWCNQYTYAFPIFKKHGMSGTFLFFTNVAGYKNHLSWNNLHELVKENVASK